MFDFLSAYSIQNWLESCPQGYLMNTEYGHPPGEVEPELLNSNPVIHAETIRTTVQLVVGERCALAASSGLINAAPDEASKRFLATQTLDEARHVEILLEKVDKKDFVAGVVGQNIVLEGMAFTVFEMMHALNQSLNPKFAHTL